MTDFAPWKHGGDIEQARDDGMVGFVYRIHVLDDELNHYKYIGRKNFWRSVRGKAKESNWKDYLSSSREMVALCNARPKSVYREILCYGRSKSELEYLEAMEMLRHDALRDPAYINRYLRLHVRREHLIKENEQ